MSEGPPRLRACIEGTGYDWGEVWPFWSSPEPPPEDSVWADPEFQQTYHACLVETGHVEPFDQARIEKENREKLEYVACMRERGWDMPDPEVSDSPLHPGLLTPRDVEPLPKDQETLDQYHRDSADCGIPVYDENDNLLPLDGSKGVS